MFLSSRNMGNFCNSCSFFLYSFLRKCMASSRACHHQYTGSSPQHSEWPPIRRHPYTSRKTIGLPPLDHTPWGVSNSLWPWVVRYDENSYDAALDVAPYRHSSCSWSFKNSHCHRSSTMFLVWFRDVRGHSDRRYHHSKTGRIVACILSIRGFVGYMLLGLPVAWELRVISR